ncbi:MAG TPA: galactose oxidase early set domain-containing protein [Planctomycetota bacterium]|nr:galactose oxidase early set domain-containing protein [Planctomycetota bacterium]
MISHLPQTFRRAAHACVPALVLAGFITPAAGTQSNPSTHGSWSPLYDWKSQIVSSCQPGQGYPEMSHAALIAVGAYAGKILMYREGLDPNTCAPTNTAEVWLFNPENPGTLLKVEQTLASDVFCGALAFDSRGRLTVAGGFPIGAGVPSQAYRFDPRVLGIALDGAPWSQPFDMSIGRYYGTLISLDRRPIAVTGSLTVPGGCQAILGGPPGLTSEGNELWQFQDPSVAVGSGSNPWLHTLVAPPGTPNAHSLPPGTLTEAYAISTTHPADPLLDSYPRAFQLGEPDPLNATILGQIFIAFDVDTTGGWPPPNTEGSAWLMRSPLSTNGPFWELAGGRNSTMSTPSPGTVWDRQYAPAVLMHTFLDKNRLLAFGGAQRITPGQNSDWQVHGSVQEFVPGSIPVSTGAWQDKTPLLTARVDDNAVILPTGQILIVGGAANFGGTSPPVPVFTPELYDPALPNQVGATYAMAQHQAPRIYHSIAALLLDGRVFVAGGRERPGQPVKSEHTGEVYRPFYLHNGTQPVITSAPGTINFTPGGTSFQVGASLFHHHVDRIVLLRPAAVTHHCDYDQRYIELEFVPPPAGSGDVIITVTPPHETLGPPGYYTLWVVEAKVANPTYLDLIPSQGKIVRLN